MKQINANAYGAFTRNEIQPDIPINNFRVLFGAFIGLSGLRNHLYRNSIL